MNIFLADDDRIIRAGMKKIITSASENYFVVGEASDGEQALEFIRSNSVDLLITDIKMPVMDGIELTNLLMKYGITLRIIVLSGFDEYQLVRESFKNGALDYLLKPLDRKELINLLHTIEGEIQNDVPVERDCVSNRGIIGTCMQYIHAHYDKKLTLAMMAEFASLSECYFSNLFKTETGKNFYDYLCEVRITKAKDLLRTMPHVKIYEIGEMVGYPEAITFNRNFKKLTGLSPRDYRNQSK